MISLQTTSFETTWDLYWDFQNAQLELTSQNSQPDLELQDFQNDQRTN